MSFTLSEEQIKELSRESFREGMRAAADIVGEAPALIFAQPDIAKLSEEQKVVFVTTVEQIVATIVDAINGAANKN